MRNKVVVGTLVLVLAVVNWSILGKQRHLAEGVRVLLEIEPVDPRSLMQGDYMELGFRVAREVRNALASLPDADGNSSLMRPSDGHVVVSVDERGVGTFKALHEGQDLGPDDILMRYRVRGARVRLATNAFFFQEGTGQLYEPARYGEFRVDGDGELLLVAMYDGELNRLGPGGGE